MAGRKGLGRGLEAILGDVQPVRQDDGAPGAGIVTLPIDKIEPDPDQPRKSFGQDELASLAQSIKDQGVIQPILVRPMGDGRFAIIAGERRWRASAAAGLSEIPVLVREVGEDGSAELALIENVQRVDLNPMEEADAYARLRDTFGRKPAEIAASVGKSRSHVANMLRLTGLPSGVRALVVSGDLSMGHARALLGAKSPEALAKRIVANDLSVRETERLANPPKAQPKAAKQEQPDPADRSNRPEKPQSAAPSPEPAKKAPRVGGGGAKDADTKSLERDLEAALGLTVSIDHQGKDGGEVRLDYATLDQLDDICARLMGTRI